MLLAVAGTLCGPDHGRGHRRFEGCARLRHESWHLIHLYGYLRRWSCLPHQLWTGADFSPAGRRPSGGFVARARGRGRLPGPASGGPRHCVGCRWRPAAPGVEHGDRGGARRRRAERARRAVLQLALPRRPRMTRANPYPVGGGRPDGEPAASPLLTWVTDRRAWPAPSWDPCPRGGSRTAGCMPGTGTRSKVPCSRPGSGDPMRAIPRNCPSARMSPLSTG